MSKIKRALISVSDKNGITDFAKDLIDLGVEIISTGGTYSALSDSGLMVTDISSVTDFPEILDGIKILQDLNFKSIKVNAVLLKGINDTEKDFDIFSNFIKAS